MFNKRYAPLWLVVALLHPGLASAEAPSPPEKTTTLEEIEVRAAVRREELQSTGATVLENSDITNRIYVTPLDIATQSPGVSIVQYGENGVAPQLMMRGFSGAHGGGLAATLDGIPLHDTGHSDGYFDTGLINPLEIESVEIIKGPASVLYGNHAQGGAMAFQSYKAGDFNRMNIRYGEDNTVDAAALIAQPALDGKLDQVYSFQQFMTDGWRDNSDWTRQNASGRWTYHFTDQFSASLNLRGYRSDWDSAGYTPNTWNTERALYNGDGGDGTGNGGNRDRFDGRIWANYLLTNNSQLTYYGFGTDLDNTRYQLGCNGKGELSSAIEQSNHRKAIGHGLAYNFDGEVAGRKSTLTLGLDYLDEDESQDIWNLVRGAGHVRGDQTTQYEFTLVTTSLFGQAEYQVIDPVKLRLGLRYDNFSGDMDTGAKNVATNRGGANRHYEAAIQEAFSPKAGIFYTPINNLELFANYGRGFSLPNMSGVSAGGNSFFTKEDADMREIDQYELGYRTNPWPWLEFGQTGYLIDTANDWTYDPIAETYDYAGETRRTGLENYLKLTFADNWSVKADYTYQTAKYRKYFSGDMDMKDRRLTNVPTHIGNAELAYEPPLGLGGRLKLRLEEGAVLRDQPSGFNAQYDADDKTTVDAQVSYRFNDRYQLLLDVTNLFDEDNYGNQGVPDEAGLFTGSMQRPRAIFLTLDVRF
ncbi:MAG: TonB-dependent receptor [Desulfobulbaceae bacterium]|jgi:iron complex outermembrane receptor protein|nr:TonB-dependent receptor [Desulfobulbaceae bacterium]